jgi:Flp pilus assembly protein protease CpaA
MGFLLGRGVTVGAMDTALNYLVAEHDFFGMTVQNWIVIVAFIFFIWSLARYISPQN